MANDQEPMTNDQRQLTSDPAKINTRSRKTNIALTKISGRKSLVTATLRLSLSEHDSPFERRKNIENVNCEPLFPPAPGSRPLVPFLNPDPRSDPRSKTAHLERCRQPQVLSQPEVTSLISQDSLQLERRNY